MYCVNCGNYDTKVLDSRSADDGKTIRRRRECENCHNRFTTFEKIEVVNLIVEKSGNKRERYDRDKLEDSILKATNKRNISINIINDVMGQLELNWLNKKEISSKKIGEDVLQILSKLDDVAYIRYASVHLNFKTSNDFIKFIGQKNK